MEALIAAAVNAYGGLDILVNNAGIEEKHPFLETPFELFRKVIDINLGGKWLCTQAAAKQMVKQQRGGRIINISSIHEELAMPTNAPYCAAKGGVRMLMRTIALELAKDGITVNDVAPGAVDTPMDAALKANPKEFDRCAPRFRSGGWRSRRRSPVSWCSSRPTPPHTSPARPT